MYFPRYWIKANLSGPNREGKTFSVEAWGWSDISEEDALQKATERAQTALSRLPIDRQHRGAYYGNRPFREPILQDASQGKLKVLITRNSLGCEVMNTDSMAFADIDYLPVRVPLWDRLFDFGGKKEQGRRQAWQEQSLEKIRSWQQANSSWGFRVYRTAGGLRLVVTTKLLTPGAGESQEWLEAVGSDPLYQQLCRTQQSFRARLTPKPWRCGLRQPSIRYPWDAPKQREAMEKWIGKYNDTCKAFAVCEFIESLGHVLPLGELKPMIDLHDSRTGAISGLPLA